jgi:hypothetical protein
VILRWNADHGQTGTESLNHPEFQRVYKDSADGKFQEVLSGLIEATEQPP